ncbi:hypothetical protein CDIK_4051 [Cucumispora dikerogammari]|nr:hypothetical protein CDIK_4051 [Cucumispora dikerogammari]
MLTIYKNNIFSLLLNILLYKYINTQFSPSTINVYFKDMIKDANLKNMIIPRNIRFEYDSTLNPDFSHCILPFSLPKIQFLFTRTPDTPYILIPICTIKNKKGETVKSSFSETIKSNEILKIENEDKIGFEYSFSYFQPMNVVNSIDFQGTKIYQRSKNPCDNRSTFMILTNEQRGSSMLYVGAFISNLSDKRGKAMETLFNDYVLQKIKKEFIEKMTFTLSLDISLLINGLHYESKKEFTKEKHMIKCSFKYIGDSKCNHTLILKMVGKIQKDEIFFQVDKYLNKRLSKDLVLICEGVDKGSEKYLNEHHIKNSSINIKDISGNKGFKRPSSEINVEEPKEKKLKVG